MNQPTYEELLKQRDELRIALTYIVDHCTNPKTMQQVAREAIAQGILRPTGVCGAAREIIEKFIKYNSPRLRQDATPTL
jgi:hypothetical protein